MSHGTLMAKLETLPDDIYNLFDPNEDHTPSEANLDELANDLKEVMRTRLRVYTPPSSVLRFSALGKPDRQVWYEAHPDGTKEELDKKTYMKFLYGDLIEAMLLFLAKEAGHTVEQQQAEVEIDGVKGHIDAIIDGVVVDVKSASPFGYKKFATDTVTQDDPFGYVNQLSGYADILTPGEDAAWLAADKVSGDICVSPLSRQVIKHYTAGPRIDHLRKVIENEQPPPRCYEDTPDGKSGNRKLVTPCGYCAHKKRCWPGLRGFAYSGGPRYLTTVVKTPDVPEFEV